jgi:hypothetical protein
MKIEKCIIENVEINGEVEGGGTVVINGRISMSGGEGCGIISCNCSNGYWISITSPRTLEGKVESIIVRFVDKREMDDFFKDHTMIPK